MPTLLRDGAALFYERHGAGAPPVVLIHGIGNHHLFEAQLDHFGRGHLTIAPDLPGVGASELPPGGRFDIAAGAEAVAWLCDELGLDAPVLIGHSMGGAMACEVAATRPHLPSALVLLDPIPIVPAPALREQRAALVAALEGEDFLTAFREFAEARMFRPSNDPELRARIVANMCATPQDILASAFASANSWSGEQLAARISCPVLIIAADGGPPADMSRTRQLLPQLEVHQTVGSGHFAHVFAAEETNAMIDGFLAAALGSPGQTRRMVSGSRSPS